MLGDLDLSLKQTLPQLFLCKPNRTTIAKLHEAFNVQLKLKLGQTNELLFDLPYEYDINHTLQNNPNISLLRDHYLIRFVYGDYVEWYIIDLPSDNVEDDKNYKQVQCYSLSYMLKHKMLQNFKTTTTASDGSLIDSPWNATRLFTSVLIGTGWQIGTIDPWFDTMYRTFDVTNTTVLDLLYQAGTTFQGIVLFDTANKKVSLVKTDSIGQDRGLKFALGHYTKLVKKEIQKDTFCTRLLVSGKDGVSIDSFMPYAQSYIEDYSYYLNPFQQDDNGNVLQSSYWMSDDLCKALITYQNKVAASMQPYQNLLTQLNASQSGLTNYQNELANLQLALKETQDSLSAANSINDSVNAAKYKQQIAILNSQIQQQQQAIYSGSSVISSLEYKITINANPFTLSDPPNMRFTYGSSVAQDQLYVTPVDGGYSLTAGNYNVSFTWIDFYGGESLPTDPTSVTIAAGQGISIQIPPFDTGAVSANIYVSPVGSNYLYLQGNIPYSAGQLMITSAPVTNTKKPPTTSTFKYLISQTFSVDGNNVSVNVRNTDTSAAIASHVANAFNQLNTKFYAYTQNNIVTVDYFTSSSINDVSPMVFHDSSSGQMNMSVTIVTAEKGYMNQIATMAKGLQPENYISPSLYAEWRDFIVEKTYEDTHSTTPQDLYNGAIVAFQSMKIPTITVVIDIVNFLEVLTEQHDWDKLNIGDIVTIDYEEFGTAIKAKIIEADFNFEEADQLKITISNYEKQLTIEDRIMRNLHYKAHTASSIVNRHASSWNTAASLSQSNNSLLNNAWDATSKPINGGGVTINNMGLQSQNPNDVTNMLMMQNGVIASSPDGGGTLNPIVNQYGIVVQNSPTSSRPSNPYLGQHWFDTTLGKPIWCSGVATDSSPATWVDATATAV